MKFQEAVEVLWMKTNSHMPLRMLTLRVINSRARQSNYRKFLRNQRVSQTSEALGFTFRLNFVYHTFDNKHEAMYLCLFSV